MVDPGVGEGPAIWEPFWSIFFKKGFWFYLQNNRLSFRPHLGNPESATDSYYVLFSKSPVADPGFAGIADRLCFDRNVRNKLFGNETLGLYGMEWPLDVTP